MQIKKIQAGYANCYLLYVESGKGLAIDPGDDGEKILKEINQLGVELEKIIITHGHFDHLGAVDFVREETGAAVLIHRLDGDCLSDPEKNLSSNFSLKVVSRPADRFLEDGEDIYLDGNPVLKVIHTPGHSPGSISLYSAQEEALFSGDLVFELGVGRTDFPGCSHDELVRSIRDKILALPEGTRIYPGHGRATTISGVKRVLTGFTREV